MSADLKMVREEAVGLSRETASPAEETTSAMSRGRTVPGVLQSREEAHVAGAE